MELRKVISEALFHHPARDFALTSVNCEIRFDPLTGKRSRIIPFRSPKLPPHDWTPYVEESRQRFCPFCPENLPRSTPRFPQEMVPGGHLKWGQAVVVPNLSPYDTYAAVTVMSPEHYLPIPALNTKLITESFRASLEFIKLARSYDPRQALYGSIGWNYMPYAGGSLIHPHLQVICGPLAGTYTEEMIRSSRTYLAEKGRCIWEDLLEAEHESGERYLGQVGGSHWLASFAPRGLADVTAIFPQKCTPEDITDKDLEELAEGLQKVLRYYEENNIASFNAAFYFARKEDTGFWCHFRIVGRYTIYPVVGSDHSHLQVLQDEFWTIYFPEEMAAELKRYF